VLLDRRKNYAILKKMAGAKGSVRDATTLVVPGLTGDQEMVMTVGCDRFLRIYDPWTTFKHKTEIGHVYLKQRLNSLLLI
jgi:chorismate mutase